MEDPAINSYSYNHLIFDKEPKTASSTSSAGKTGYPHVEVWI
jgi:hypothetical protein